MKEHAGEYITGQAPEILDMYPELGYYRDIVFNFKYLMAPYAEALPEIKQWMPIEAMLLWKYKETKEDSQKAKGVLGWFQVRGFGKKLNCVADHKSRQDPEEEERKRREKKGLLQSIKTLVFGAKPRVPPSG